MPRTIADLHVADRPREKLQKYGAARLLDEELLAILIRTGKAGKSAITLAKEVLKAIQRNNNTVSFTELLQIKGIGKAKACEIIAAIELSRRLENVSKDVIIKNAKDIWLALTDIRGSKKEHLVVFYLHATNELLKREIISIGTLTGTHAHPREIFEQAILLGAATIIVAHNHPSKNLEPSAEDMLITQQLIASGEILNILLQDHVIVCEDAYFSFKDAGLLTLPIAEND